MPSSLSTITSSISKVKVSPNVLKMQFMKKTMVKLEQEERARQKLTKVEQPISKPAKIYPTAETIHDEPTCSLGGMITEERFTFLEDLRFGRFSYHKQNPDVEKVMLFHEYKRLGIDPPEEDPEEEGELKEEEGEQEVVGGNQLELLDQWQGSRSALTEDTTPRIRCIKQANKRQKFNNNKRPDGEPWRGNNNKQPREDGGEQNAEQSLYSLPRKPFKRPHSASKRGGRKTNRH